jgi:hypothetical protein
LNGAFLWNNCATHLICSSKLKDISFETVFAVLAQAVAI